MSRGRLAGFLRTVRAFVRRDLAIAASYRFNVVLQAISACVLIALLYFVAISRLPVGIGLLFEFTAPAFVALWVRFRERQEVRRRLWVGLLLCLAGLVSVAELWAGELRLVDGLLRALQIGLVDLLGGRSLLLKRPQAIAGLSFGGVAGGRAQRLLQRLQLCARALGFILDVLFEYMRSRLVAWAEPSQAIVVGST